MKINFAVSSFYTPLPRYLCDALNLIYILIKSTLSNSMNESVPLSSSPSSSPSSKLPLNSLQEIIHNRIMQKKREMHPSHNKVYLESLSTEIQTLQWVSAQILMLLRQ
jgi:hypothetical protein